VRRERRSGSRLQGCSKPRKGMKASGESLGVCGDAMWRMCRTEKRTRTTTTRMHAMMCRDTCT
jgi:hypothetical protein